MKALLYGISIQFKMDIRSKSMLITCYLVPLVFFLFMGGILTSIDTNATKTLIPSMTVFTITMSALCGLPPAVAEIYGTDIKKMYKANGAPIWFGIVSQFVSSFIHTFIVCFNYFCAFSANFQSGITFQSNMVFLFGNYISSRDFGNRQYYWTVV